MPFSVCLMELCLQTYAIILVTLINSYKNFKLFNLKNGTYLKFSNSQFLVESILESMIKTVVQNNVTEGGANFRRSSF